MILVGFSRNTSKLFPKIFCRKFKHCAPVFKVCDDMYIMLQFVRRGYVAQISVNEHGINLLRAQGWEFINLDNDASNSTANIYDDNMRPDIIMAESCVDLCMTVIGMHAPYIKTPYGLYKKLKRHMAP